MDLGLDGKTVVLTGAAGGIGRELASGFAAQGAQLVGVDIASMDDVDLQHRVRIDLADPESVRQGCRTIRNECPQVDVLINNAALYGGLKMTPLQRLDLQEWDRVMAVNVRGAYLMVRELLEPLIESRGAIVNMASASALRGSPMMLHYVASKGALIAMTRALATELGPHGIRVNAVAPGLVDDRASQGLGEAYQRVLQSTLAQQSIPLKLEAGEVVGTVLFLASQWSRAVTGQTIPVDRGLVKS